MNTVDLGAGYQAKIEVPFTYGLEADQPGKDVIDCVDDCIDDFAKIDNEGSFIADRLFLWQKPTVSKTEYRKLEEDAKSSVTKAALLTRLRKILKITEGTHTLKINEPKVKK